MKAWVRGQRNILIFDPGIQRSYCNKTQIKSMMYYELMYINLTSCKVILRVMMHYELFIRVLYAVDLLPRVFEMEKCRASYPVFRDRKEAW